MTDCAGVSAVTPMLTQMALQQKQPEMGVVGVYIRYNDGKAHITIATGLIFDQL